MNDDDRRRGPRPIPVTEAVRDLIRKTAADRPPETPEAAEAPGPAEPPTRSFQVDGESWIARIAGEGAGGTGSLAPATLVAVRFFRADDPDRPLRETILPGGRFERLHDHEFAAILRTARPLGTDPDDA